MNSPKMRQLQSANRALHVKLEERDRRIGLLEHEVHVLQEPRDRLVTHHDKEVAALRGVHEQMLRAHDQERAELRAQILQLQAELATRKQQLTVWEEFGAAVGNRLNATHIAVRSRESDKSFTYDPAKYYITTRIEYPGALGDIIGKKLDGGTTEVHGRIVDACADGQADGVFRVLVECDKPLPGSLFRQEPMSMGCTSRA